MTEIVQRETRQRMSAAERRAMVLEAAIVEFAARGLAGTSTEDVARRAGISQPYLFRLFPTKKALFLALVEQCFRRVEDTFTTAAGDRTGDEALMAMADAYEVLLEDRTLLLMQMQAYAACDDPEIRDCDPGPLQEAVGTGRADHRAPLPDRGGLLRRRHADERGRGDGPAVGGRKVDQVVPERLSRAVSRLRFFLTDVASDQSLHRRKR